MINPKLTAPVSEQVAYNAARKAFEPDTKGIAKGVSASLNVQRGEHAKLIGASIKIQINT